MNESDNNSKELKELTKEEIENMNFYETALYIQTLNQIEEVNDLINNDFSDE